MAVNSTVKVSKLNADMLDGLDATKFPRATRVPYNLAPEANSAPIAVPQNRPVLVMGVNIDGAESSIAHVTLLRSPENNNLIWVGMESYRSFTITQGASGQTGTHIVWIDFDGTVQIQTVEGGAIRIRNDSGRKRTGHVTLIW